MHKEVFTHTMPAFAFGHMIVKTNIDFPTWQVILPKPHSFEFSIFLLLLLLLFIAFLKCAG